MSCGQAEAAVIKRRAPVLARPVGQRDNHLQAQRRPPKFKLGISLHQFATCGALSASVCAVWISLQQMYSTGLSAWRVVSVAALALSTVSPAVASPILGRSPLCIYLQRLHAALAAYQKQVRNEADWTVVGGSGRVRVEQAAMLIAL